MHFISCLKKASSWNCNKQTFLLAKSSMMIALCFVILVVAGCPFETLSAPMKNALKKRSCFSSFEAAEDPTAMGQNSSNIKCQQTCRDKGYILAATKGSQCHCGNLFPEEKPVADSECNTRCRSSTPCYSPQTCCGGPNAYSVSAVGNIDLAKQILRRLVHKWQSESEYRDWETRKAKSFSHFSKNHGLVQSYPDKDQPTPMYQEGWSKCGKGRYMARVWRSNYVQNVSKIDRIDYVTCLGLDAPEDEVPSENYQSCYIYDVTMKFDHMGWSTCKQGYYMTGLYRSPGSMLLNIEKFECCRPKKEEEKWAECYNHDASLSFDDSAWTSCNKEYLLAGLYRNDCDALGCKEEFKCCKMGEYKRPSSLTSPDFVIYVKDASNEFKRCSMNSMDKSEASTTFKCEALSNHKNMIELKEDFFMSYDKTTSNVGQPKRPSGFTPAVCSSQRKAYTCKKSLSATISASSSATIGSGFEMPVDKPFHFRSRYLNEVFSSSSFNAEHSTEKSFETPDETLVTVEVPKNTEIKLDLLSTVADAEYKWKASFELSGKFYIKWNNGFAKFEDLKDVYINRFMYAFGALRYTETVLKVVITDDSGKEKAHGCEHIAGQNEKDCKIKVN